MIDVVVLFFLPGVRARAVTSDLRLPEALQQMVAIRFALHPLLRERRPDRFWKSSGAAAAAPANPSRWRDRWTGRPGAGQYPPWLPPPPPRLPPP
jgi:hypothetical protein